MGLVKGLPVPVLIALSLALASCGPKPHNVIIFVADGLRSQMVTPETGARHGHAVRAEGVDFQNSHSVYPTLTTVNASSIATGHLPGDHGDFGNALFTGEDLLAFPVNGATPFLEDDETLGLMNARFGNNYLDEASLLVGIGVRAQGLPDRRHRQGRTHLHPGRHGAPRRDPDHRR